MWYVPTISSCSIGRKFGQDSSSYSLGVVILPPPNEWRIDVYFFPCGRGTEAWRREPSATLAVIIYLLPTLQWYWFLWALQQKSSPSLTALGFCRCFSCWLHNNNTAMATISNIHMCCFLLRLRFVAGENFPAVGEKQKFWPPSVDAEKSLEGMVGFVFLN